MTLTISSLGPGDRVQHELLVLDRAEKKTGAGDPFVILTLGNRSGRIDTAPIWSNQLEWAEGARTGKVVQAVGEVKLYSKGGPSKRQLELSGPVRVLPDDTFRAEEFLPSIDGDVQKLWAWVDRTRSEVESATLRRPLRSSSVTSTVPSGWTVAGNRARTWRLRFFVARVCAVCAGCAVLLRMTGGASSF